MNRRPCWVEISTGALQKNYQLLCAIGAEPPQSIVHENTPSETRPSEIPCAEMPIAMLAIVKADAYGHGLELCAPAVARAGARWLGVTSIEEGVAARALCPDAEILAISGPFLGQGAVAAAHRLTVVVWETWQLEELESAGAPVTVHLELDTGMSRQGVGADDLEAILGRFGASSTLHSTLRPTLRLDGLMTHLFAADESDGATSRDQLVALETMVSQVFAAGLRPTWLHVGNSAAVLGGMVLPELAAICERFGLKAMARPGLALYGLVPEYEPDEPAPVAALRARLQRVLAWKTRIVTVRSIEAGAVVGYNGTFVAAEPMRVALLAVGYADGLKRGLSNRGAVLVQGQRAPISGRISMDQTVVNVTGIAGVATGDEVVLLGRQGADTITAEDHGRWAETIPWEIFTSITNRVERVAI